MAIDQKGDLWIFELKAWESEEKNILQVLRYGQIFGQYDYEYINDIYARLNRDQLFETYKKDFQIQRFPKKILKRKQHFVVITNGLDVRTRQSIHYWKNKGLDLG